MNRREFLRDSTVWVVGQYRSQGEPWEMQGIYTDKQDAVAVCVDRTFFVGPVELNVAMPGERVTWPGLYYPLAQEDSNESA